MKQSCLACVSRKSFNFLFVKKQSDSVFPRNTGTGNHCGCTARLSQKPQMAYFRKVVQKCNCDISVRTLLSLDQS